MKTRQTYPGGGSRKVMYNCTTHVTPNCTTHVTPNCTTPVVMGPSQGGALAWGECRYRGFYSVQIPPACVSGMVFQGVRGRARRGAAWPGRARPGEARQGKGE